MPQQQNIDLTSCEREQIHIPGSIQPHGVLLAVDADFLIRMVSANSQAIIGYRPDKLLGSSLQSMFEDADIASLRAAFASDAITQVNPIKLTISNSQLGLLPRHFDGILHRSGTLVLLELEPNDLNVSTKNDSVFKEFYHTLQKAIVRFQANSNVFDLCNSVAEEVRHITGFDRVMVYRFDTDWHGEVIAECKRPELEPFLGLHFPASDIPPQARLLYEKNWLRLIPNADYEPALLYPNRGMQNGQALDLSYAVLRSVSPMHCKYLQNMNVHASMSISLLRDGSRLWGLIACHHGSPKLVPYQCRLTCELIGQSISLLISAHERLVVSQTMQNSESIRAAFIDQAASEGTFEERAHGLPENFLKIVEADGACILIEGKLLSLGLVPPDTHILDLAAKLNSQSRQEPFMTESLSRIFASAQAYASKASGMLSIPFGGESSEDRLFWFRKEKIHSVNWSGNPQQAVFEVENGLGPRRSFALWQETVRQTSLKWSPVDKTIAIGLVHAIHHLILTKARETQKLNRQLRESERAKDEFLAIISHELRTPLNAILGWIEVLEGGTISQHECKEVYATIHRNAKAQKQLVEDLLDVSRIINGNMRLNIEEFNPKDIVADVIETMRKTAEEQSIAIESSLDPAITTMIGDPTRFQQIVWNILSNAVKFTPYGGHIQLKFSRNDLFFELTISDNGEGIDDAFLPFVFDRFKHADSKANRRHQGLGLGLSIVRQLVELHGGKVQVSSAGKNQGATFTVELPTTYFKLDGVRSPKPGNESSELPQTDELRGLHVLVVEDSPDSRFLIERVLMDLGAKVISVDSGDSALAALKRNHFDLLISDIGMPKMDGYALMQIVRSLPHDQGGTTPAIALTAFASEGDRARATEAGFDAHITKPISLIDLIAAVAKTAGPKR